MRIVRTVLACLTLLAATGALGPATAASAAPPSPVSNVRGSAALASYPYAPSTTTYVRDDPHRCNGYPHEAAMPPGCGGFLVQVDINGFRQLAGFQVQAGYHLTAHARIGATYGCVDDATGHRRTTYRAQEYREVPAFEFTGTFGYWWYNATDAAYPIFSVRFPPVPLTCRPGETPAHLSTTASRLSIDELGGDGVRLATWRVPGRWSSYLAR